jgi:hypothetical protein
VNPPTFRTLLYRYFFFGWLFKDASVGDLFERAAAQRHNRQQASWLPVYMARWLCCALILYGLGGFHDIFLGATVMAHWFYAFSAMCLSFAISVATAWVGMRQRKEQA